MFLKEQVIQELEDLPEVELKEIAEFVAFLKFRSRIKTTPGFDENKVANLYSKFAAEDRALSEEGMPDYVMGLIKEDS